MNNNYFPVGRSLPYPDTLEIIKQAYKDHDEKLQIIKIYIEDSSNCNNYLEYFEKFRVFLSKNTFNNLTKDILSL